MCPSIYNGIQMPQFDDETNYECVNSSQTTFNLFILLLFKIKEIIYENYT